MWTGAYTTPITTGIPVVTTTALAAGNVGVPYSWQLTATGTNGAVKWDVTGTLPAGLTLSRSGLISGTPTAAVTASGLVFIVTDSLNQTDSSVALSLQVNATTGAPDPPAAMWLGAVTSNRAQIHWWPAATIGNVTQNNPADTNTYNVYRVDAGTTPIATGIVGKTRGGLTLLTLWYMDLTLTKSTTYQYYVRALSAGGVLSAPGPTLTVTTLAGSDTPPTPPAPVANPDTWIAPFALPVGGTTWLASDNAVGGTNTGWNNPGTRSGNTVSGCGFQFALTNAALAGGDLIVLTAGASYACPSAGFVPPVFTGVNGWTYIISSEDPVYKAGGKLPAYEFSTNTRPVKLTLTGACAVGATQAVLAPNGGPGVDSTGKWTRKTGLYPVHFYGSAAVEERLVLFQNGNAAIFWNGLNEVGTNQNPVGWDGVKTTPGPGLAQAAPATISMNYLPGVTLSDKAALAIIRIGAGGGMTLPLHTNKIRLVGIWFKPVAGATTPFSISTVSGGGGPATKNSQAGDYTNFYYDRCMVGCDTTTFQTSGPPDYTVNPVDFGAVTHGITNLFCDNMLVHGCYIQGCQVAPTAAAAGQDSQAVFTAAGGPLCIQNSYLEAVAEGFIAGGTGIPKNNIPHDLTCRYNYNTKPLWWAWGPSQTCYFYHPSVSGTAGQFISAPTYLTVGELVTISGTSTGPGSIAGYVNPTTYKVSSVTANVSPYTFTLTTQAGAPLVTTVGATAGLAFTFPTPIGTAQIGTIFYLGDYVKNTFELKCMIRANVYGNTHQNSYNCTGSPGQQGTQWGCGARDQTAGDTTTTISNTSPWAAITDVDFHDNVTYQGGRGGGTFGGVDANPAVVTTRIRTQNNHFLVMNVQSNWDNGTTVNTGQGFDVSYRHPGSGGTNFAYQDNGILADIIIDHNTWVTDYTYSYYSTYAEQKAFFPVGSTSQPYNYDRHQITNNIWTGKIKGDGLAGDATDPYLTDEKWTNLIWANNLLQTDYDSPLPAGVVYRPAVNTSIAFNTMGFANFIDSRHQPMQPSDWNIVSGTYATADQTGGPVGATFAAPGALNFPLLGSYLIAGVIDPGTVAHIASQGAIIINGFQGYAGLQGHVANAKAANPSMKVCSYVKINSMVPNDSGFQGKWTQGNSANWWARAAFPAGAIATEFGGGENAFNIIQNRTSANAPFPGGPTTAQTIRQWMAQYNNHYMGPGVASNLDGLFTDNFYPQPEAVSGGIKQADWNEDGTVESDLGATTMQNWRNAYADWDTQIRAAMGSQYMHWANVAEWSSGTLTGLTGFLNGGVYEHAVNAAGPGGDENNSWTFMMNGYKAMMNGMVPFNGQGPYLIFQEDGSVTAYQGFRYGYCSCLLDNGYFYFSPNSSDASIGWFDEFTFNLGAPIAGPNNPSNGTYSSGGLTAWQNGVWRRDFQNGIALVNPRGNGPQTVVVDAANPFWHLRGAQANPPNSATQVAAGGTVTLADRDGLILSRTAT